MRNLLVLSFALFSSFAVAATAPAGSYKIDTAHSSVGFEVPHLVISTVEGKFNTFEGSIDLADKFEASKVTAKVKTESVDTGVAKRDSHLKNSDFFEVSKFPEMTFTSTEIKGTPDNFKMTGDLKIKGTTKKVTFEGKYLGAVKDPSGAQKTAFNASTKINRKDFGLVYGNMVEAGPVIGDQVTITLKIQAAGGEATAKK